jgi:hypothetical protein
MDIIHIDNLGYKVQDQKVVPVWYTGTYKPFSNTGHIVILSTRNLHYNGNLE